MRESTYDRLVNEGGGGYNPYRAKREHAEWQAAQERAKQHTQTPQGKIDALQRRLERECGSVAREWGNMEEIDALQNDLHSQIKQIEDGINAEFLAVWTPEETHKRRVEWNARVKNGEFSNGNRVDFRAMAAQEKRQGWALDTLKKAVKLNRS